MRADERVFPTRADGRAVWDAGYRDGLRGLDRARTPRAGADFRERCLTLAYLNGWNQGLQETAQDRYGTPPPPVPPGS